MKFSLTFKTPDVTDQVDVPAGQKKEAIEDFLRKWLEYGEYVTLDFDTELGTAVVRRQR